MSEPQPRPRARRVGDLSLYHDRATASHRVESLVDAARRRASGAGSRAMSALRSRPLAIPFVGVAVVVAAAVVFAALGWTSIQSRFKSIEEGVAAAESSAAAAQQAAATAKEENKQAIERIDGQLADLPDFTAMDERITEAAGKAEEVGRSAAEAGQVAAAAGSQVREALRRIDLLETETESLAAKLGVFAESIRLDAAEAVEIYLRRGEKALISQLEDQDGQRVVVVATAAGFETLMREVDAAEEKATQEFLVADTHANNAAAQVIRLEAAAEKALAEAETAADPARLREAAEQAMELARKLQGEAEASKAAREAARLRINALRARAAAISRTQEILRRSQ